MYFGKQFWNFQNQIAKISVQGRQVGFVAFYFPLIDLVFIKYSAYIQIYWPSTKFIDWVQVKSEIFNNIIYLKLGVHFNELVFSSTL